MRSLLQCLVIISLLSTYSTPAWAVDLTDDIKLIQRLGKLESDRRAKADEPPTQAEMRNAAKVIDQYMDNYYRENKVRPNRRADDDTFVRRIYLDIAGRIPTLPETIEFLDDKRGNKRYLLIDKLLESEAYISHNFNWWSDLLRIQSGNGNRYGGQAYANWIKQALRENKPYNDIVYELITAEGYPWENGAAGYYLRDDGMPLDHMATSIQVFLGTSLQCAQCHDHPFDRWSQYEFYEMAAYTFGMNTRTNAPNLREAQKLLGNDRAARTALNNLARPLQYGVSFGDRNLQLPHDYQYNDAKPYEVIKPYTIFGSEATPKDGESLRDAYARWMIDKNNPRFTLSISNRMWQKAFGIALIEPMDMMMDDSDAQHPQLLNFLTYKMESFGYDLRQFQRMLYYTELYQREATIRDRIDGETYHFPGPMLHRMTAEQFWDSLVTLAIPEPDYRRGPLSDTSYYRQVLALQNAEPEQLAAAARERAAYDTQRREINDKIREAREANDDAEVQRLRTQMNAIPRPQGLMMSMMEMEEMTNESGATSGNTLDYGYDIPSRPPSTWEGYPAYLVRASEVGSPAPAGHFLLLFGQSDRETLNNSNIEPNIIQVLAMFNGNMFGEVIKPNGSQLMKYIEGEQLPANKVRVIFQGLLNREPTKREIGLIEESFARDIAAGKSPDYGKIIWAVLNTREFSFVK